MTHNKGKFKARILDATDINRALARIAHQILERNPNTSDLVFIGIRQRGVPLAKRLSEIMKEIEGKPIAMEILDIHLYEDHSTCSDLEPVVQPPEIGTDLAEKTVILVDDVLFTGRTIHSALDALRNLGKPKSIQAAVLIDRGHRRLPIHADFVGKNVPTGSNEIVNVMLKEIDKEDQVIIMEKE
jgi:pyrimidine operon attenuation protein / uracil phosphoribosyltransferase